MATNSLLIIFTYASAGFGHLRVMDALYSGLEDKTNSIVIGSQDQALTFFHRLTSVHPLIRGFFEWMQQGAPEEIFAHLYKTSLRARTSRLEKQINSILSQVVTKPKRLLIISTHFGLAHQFGKLKRKIETEHKVKLFLVVQVTDDSPQKLWYVPEADIIFVPSSHTRDKLIEYGKKHNFPQPQFEVITYPISPLLTNKASEAYFQTRSRQVNPARDEQINVLIPISGAAVGLDFFIQLTKMLHEKNKRFKFHILVKKTLYTEMFMSKMIELPYINLHVFSEDRQMVDQYEEIYHREVISFEITKPSEQSFKALLSPSQVGGSILLFTSPVGRQEYDNLKFLARNSLIPGLEQTLREWRKIKETKPLDIVEAENLRGIQLPRKPQQAATFIDKMLKEGVFLKMLNFRNLSILDSTGVAKFWQRVEDLLKTA